MIKKGLKVKILTGKDKNKDGEVIEIDRPNNRAKVKGINIVKKHTKTTKWDWYSKANDSDECCTTKKQMFENTLHWWAYYLINILNIYAYNGNIQKKIKS